MKLTVFTPTYNRAYILDRLYLSLCRQTCMDFEWLIIDDGSEDNTRELVEGWIIDSKINIRYYYQKNQGKSMAHNKGVELTNTELFVCVDSDDYLEDNAVEVILRLWNASTENSVGILAFKRTKEKTITKICIKEMPIYTTLKNAYDYLGLRGDTMLIFKSDVIKKYSFPHFVGEKFVPEAYLYDQIDQDGALILYPEALYVCEYLENGYTDNMAKLLKNNPKGYLAFIEQRLKIDKTFKHKFMDSIRYISMALVSKKNCIIKNSVYKWITLIAYPFGVVLYYKRYKNI